MRAVSDGDSREMDGSHIRSGHDIYLMLKIKKGSASLLKYRRNGDFLVSYDVQLAQDLVSYER